MQAGGEAGRDFVDIDLFAGAGGLAVGLKEASFSPTQLYEVDKHSCATLRWNADSTASVLEGSVYEGDVTKIDWHDLATPIRLLATGTPCQPFSLGGKHLAEHDGRNLFPELIRAVRELRPAAILLENVRGLARPSFRPYFDYVLRQLECPSVEPRADELWQQHDARIRYHQGSAEYEPEYNVAWRLVDAADFGVPQNRQRIFIVATQKYLPKYRFPTPTHSRDALLRVQSSGEYWDKRGILKPDAIRDVNPLPGLDGEGRLPWVTVRDTLEGLPAPAPSEREAWMNHWLIPGARVYKGHVGSTLDWPSKTIKAGVHGVPGGENTLVGDDGNVRYYTLREIARVQTFPDTYFFTGARTHVTRQIGNAVPCRLASAVARPLFELMTRCNQWKRKR